MKSSASNLAAVVIALLCIGAASASASCATREEQREVRRALRSWLRCAELKLRTAGLDCTPDPPPSCAGTHYDDVFGLLGGLPSEPAPTTDTQRCQSDVFRGATRFVTRRMTERRKEIRPQSRSVRALELRHCNVEIADAGNATFPRFAGRCARLMSDHDGSLTNLGVRNCLRPELEKIVGALVGAGTIEPNVLLIVTDDQHPEAIQYMPEVLSRIADAGVRFTNGFTITPVCAPSRAGILTGQTPQRNGVTANLLPDGQGWVTDGALNLDDTSTLANWLQARGYRTALHGKYLNGYNYISPSVPLGWDDWRVFIPDDLNFFNYSLNENGLPIRYGDRSRDYSTDVLLKHAVRFIDRNKRDPFLLAFAPFAPHAPSIPAPRHDDALGNAPSWRPPSWAAFDPNKPDWFRFFSKSEAELIERDPQFADQRESLLSVDEAVGRLLDRLERLGLLDNTIVVFTSDHGLLWGEHGWVAKRVVYEESIRVPLAIRYPIALPYGATADAPVLNIDIAPTITTLAGFHPVGHAFDGRPLTELLAGATDWRSDFLIEHFEGGGPIVPPWKAVRDQQYKYARHDNGFEELYDLETDPYELSNVAMEPAYFAILAAMSARLDELSAAR